MYFTYFNPQQSTVLLDLCMGHDYRLRQRFRRAPFHFRSHEEPLFSNSSGLNSVFEKLRSHDGLVSMVGLYRNKAAFSNFPSETGRYLILTLD